MTRNELDMRDIDLYLNSGEQHAFTRIYMRYKDLIKSSMMNKMIYDNNNVAFLDDVVNEIWIKVAKSLHRFNGDSEFATWLFTVTRTTYLTQVVRKDNQLIADQKHRADKVITANISDEEYAKDDADCVWNQLDEGIRLRESDVESAAAAWHRAKNIMPRGASKTIQLEDQGMTIRDIVRETGRGKSTVERDLTLFRIEYRKQLSMIETGEKYV